MLDLLQLVCKYGFRQQGDKCLLYIPSNSALIDAYTFKLLRGYFGLDIGFMYTHDSSMLKIDIYSENWERRRHVLQFIIGKDNKFDGYPYSIQNYTMEM